MSSSICLLQILAYKSRLPTLEILFFFSGQEVPLSLGLSMLPGQLPNSECLSLLGPCCLKQDHRASINAENILLHQIPEGRQEGARRNFPLPP